MLIRNYEKSDLEEAVAMHYCFLSKEGCYEHLRELGSKDFRGLVIADGGEIVGMCTYKVIDKKYINNKYAKQVHIPNNTEEVIVLLDTMVVKQNRIKSGYGSRLHESLESLLLQEFKKVTLIAFSVIDYVTQKVNSERLAIKNGFKEIERIDDFWINSGSNDCPCCPGNCHCGAVVFIKNIG